MATGDLQNNLRKLKGQLKLAQFPHEPDYEKLSKGCAESFLPIYHYLMVDYSQPLAQCIADMGVEFYAKTDVRFIEAMYKVLREVCSYKPPLTKEQFFANGFVERKVIMCTEIVGRLREWHKQRAPKVVRVKPNGPIGANKLGPRSCSAPTASTKPTVLKRPELENLVNVAAPPTGLECSVPKVEQAQSPILKPTCKPSSMTAYVEPHFRAVGDGIPMTVTTRLEAEPAVLEAGRLSESNINRMSTSSVEVISMNRGVFPDHPVAPQSSPEGVHLRPIDVIANTPGTSLRNLDISPQQHISALEQTVRTLNAKVLSLEEQVSSMQAIDRQLQGVTPQVQQPLTGQLSGLPPEQLESIMARLLLLENRVAIVESRSQASMTISAGSASTEKSLNVCHGQSNMGLADPSATHSYSEVHMPTSIPSPQCTKTPIAAGHLMPAPDAPSPILPAHVPKPIEIRHSPGLVSSHNVENHSPRSLPNFTSTPADPSRNGTETLTPHFSRNACQATRIKQMLKETENLLNIEVASPVKSPACIES